MRRLLALMMCAVGLGATAQIEYPYNPDGNADSLISVPDIQDFLAVYGTTFVPDELMVGDSLLSAWIAGISETVSQQASTIDSLIQIVDQLHDELDSQSNSPLQEAGLVDGEQCTRIGATSYHLGHSQFVVCSPYAGAISGFLSTEQPLTCEDKVGYSSSNLNFWMSFEVTDTLVVRNMDFDPQKKYGNDCADAGFDLQFYQNDTAVFSEDNVGQVTAFMHKVLLPGFVYTIGLDNLVLGNGNCFSCGYGAALTSVETIQSRLSPYFDNVRFYRSSDGGPMQLETQSWLLSVGELFHVSPLQDLRWVTVGNGSISW